MKIKDIKNEKCYFKDLECGTVFKKVYDIDNMIFMKTERSYENKMGERLNAVRLTDGELFCFKGMEEVIKIECELVIK